MSKFLISHNLTIKNDNDDFCGRTHKSVLARHYTDYNPERLRQIYEEANIRKVNFYLTNQNRENR